MDKPIILLDVDGVLNPCPWKPEDSPDWKFEPRWPSSTESGAFPLSLSKEMGQALADLNCQIRWLTTWILTEDFANPEIGKRLGWDRLPVCHIERRFSDNYWKPTAVQKILETEGPKVVWIDDDADYYAQVFDGISDPFGRLLIICPDSHVGLTRDHIDTIKVFLKD